MNFTAKKEVKIKKSTFIACIEQEPKMAFEIEWSKDQVPSDIEFPDGSVIKLVGKYASIGERFCYQHVAPVKLSEDQFKIVAFNKLAMTA